jgi:molybdopterin/thiamine biosynthesis adenylyltransferase
VALAADLGRSRPLRLAAQVTGGKEADLSNVFAGRVAVHLAGDQAGRPDAHETFLFAVNQILRFAPNLSISLPDSEFDLAQQVRALAKGIVAPGAEIPLIVDDHSAIVTLTIGTALAPTTTGVAVSSSGWLARTLTSASEASLLPEPTGPLNPLGALAAACLGAGQVFMALAGVPLLDEPVELSLFDRTCGAPGQLTDGPPLPVGALELDSLLVGCGAVMNGFAYTLVRLPVKGRARAVDRQRLRTENIGPYVLSSLELLGIEKAQVLARALAPQINVIPYAEDFDPLFTVRLERGHFPLPPIVVAGLDNVVTRHTVQRLWPAILIDMGAGGSTAQVILKRRAEPGMCLLEALHVPPWEQGDVERLASESGLALRSVRAMDSPISEQDVLDAPSELRGALATARELKMLRCGFIRARALDHERQSEEFAAAAPFVVAYSGVVAAAELMKEMMGVNQPGSMRYQASHTSLRTRAVSPPALKDCECARIAGTRTFTAPGPLMPPWRSARGEEHLCQLSGPELVR